MLDALFTPFSSAKLELPNRWVMAPMTRKRSPGGSPPPDVAEYYRRRAAGGIGLIVTEGTLVDHPLASPDDDIPRIGPDQRAAWGEVIRAIHGEGSKVFVQLWHQGPMARPGIGAAPVTEDGSQVVRAASAADRDDLAAAFVEGAVEAQRAGFDGIEFHGAHGYLLDSFMRAGELDYLGAIVRETRRRVGPDYPLALRFSQWRVGAFEDRQFASPQDLEAALLPLRDAGVDLFHASTRRFWLPEFEGSDLNLAGWTRKLTGAPTITVGNIGLETASFLADGPASARELQRRYDRGEFDLVAVGRPLISDAEWANKVGRDRAAQIADYTPEANRVYP